MSVNKRLNDLERETGGGDETAIVMTWGDDPDQIVNVRGEPMTYKKFCERYPDHKRINFNWDDSPHPVDL